MMRSLSELLRILAEAGNQGPDRVADAYLGNILDIHKDLSRLPGLKAEMGLRDLSSAADYLRFAAFAYDLTSVYFYGGEEKFYINAHP